MEKPHRQHATHSVVRARNKAMKAKVFVHHNQLAGQSIVPIGVCALAFSMFVAAWVQRQRLELYVRRRLAANWLNRAIAENHYAIFIKKKVTQQ